MPPINLTDPASACQVAICCAIALVQLSGSSGTQDSLVTVHAAGRVGACGIGHRPWTRQPFSREEVRRAPPLSEWPLGATGRPRPRPEVRVLGSTPPPGGWGHAGPARPRSPKPFHQQDLSPVGRHMVAWGESANPRNEAPPIPKPGRATPGARAMRWPADVALPGFPMGGLVDLGFADSPQATICRPPGWKYGQARGPALLFRTLVGAAGDRLRPWPLPQGTLSHHLKKELRDVPTESDYQEFPM